KPKPFPRRFTAEQAPPPCLPALLSWRGRFGGKITGGRNGTMTATNPYEIGLDKNAANFVALTPIGFLRRSASVYPNRLAVAYGGRRYSWREALARCRRLAGALAARGIGRGDTV